MNNTPLKWNNQTTFVPAKPPEKTMTTFDHLENAERELRSALGSTSNRDNSNQLRRIVEMIGTLEDIKRLYRPASTFTVSGSYEPHYGMYSTCQLDTINFGAAQPVNIPGSLGSDVITFS
jgi:hypothetical protein